MLLVEQKQQKKFCLGTFRYPSQLPKTVILCAMAWEEGTIGKHSKGCGESLWPFSVRQGMSMHNSPLCFFIL